MKDSLSTSEGDEHLLGAGKASERHCWLGCGTVAREHWEEVGGSADLSMLSLQDLSEAVAGQTGWRKAPHEI